MKRIAVFGGGIAHGLWDKNGGWSERLRKELYARTIETNGSDHFELYNFAIRGDSSQQILDRFQSNMGSLEEHGDDVEQITILHVGGNDAQFIYEEDEVRTPPEKFQENVEKLLDQALEGSEKVVIMTLMPVQDEDASPIPAKSGRSYTNNRMKEYSKIIREAAGREEDVVLFDLFKLFNGKQDEMLEDGIHPNTEGHQLIYKKLKNKLSNEEII